MNTQFHTGPENQFKHRELFVFFFVVFFESTILKLNHKHLITTAADLF